MFLGVCVSAFLIHFSMFDKDFEAIFMAGGVKTVTDPSYSAFLG